MEDKIVEKTQDKSQENSNDNVDGETSVTDNSQNDKGKDNFEKRYSDSSRENTRITKVHTAYRKVLTDNSHLLELDADLAKDVVDQLYEDWYSDTNSYEELVKILKGDDKSEKSEKIDEDTLVKNIRAKILEENQEADAKKVLDKSLSKFDEGTKNKYLEEFKESVWKRKLTPELAKKEIDKIILYNNRKELKQDRDDDALSKLASNNLWGSKETSKTTMTTAKLTSLWMPKAQQRARYPELFTK